MATKDPHAPGLNRRRLVQAALCSLAPAWFAPAQAAANNRSTLVIAHRGASGYLPEHTLAAKALAHAQGADFIEQDIALSRDDVPIVIHDLTLDATTNVAAAYPGRAREDGRHYVVDFTLAELQTLEVGERRGKSGAPRYPDRFPIALTPFRLHTLEQELSLIQGLNQRMGRQAGIYPELKSPAWHGDEGKDIVAAVLPVLEQFGYLEPGAPMFLQCFEPEPLLQINAEIGKGPKLVQLLGENRWWPNSNVDYDKMKTLEGVEAVAGYASGIGPWLGQILPGGAAYAPLLVQHARKNKLAIHPYTVRADQLPAGYERLDALLDTLVGEIGVDGLFTDFPDQVLQYLGRA